MTLFSNDTDVRLIKLIEFSVSGNPNEAANILSAVGALKQAEAIKELARAMDNVAAALRNK